MASDAMLYFNSIGCSPLIAMNPAEFLIDLANGNINDKSIPSELESKNFVTDTKPSPVQVQEYLAGVCGERAAKLRAEEFLKSAILCSQLEMEMTVNTRERGATWCEQFLVLCSRGFTERRHEYFSMMRVMQVVATALIIGSLWWRCNSSSPRGLQDQGLGIGRFSTEYFSIHYATMSFSISSDLLCTEDSNSLSTIFDSQPPFSDDESIDGLIQDESNFVDQLPELPLIPLDSSARLQSVSWILKVRAYYNFHALTAYVAVDYLDRFHSSYRLPGLGLSIGAAFMDVKKATTFVSPCGVL